MILVGWPQSPGLRNYRQDTTSPERAAKVHFRLLILYLSPFQGYKPKPIEHQRVEGLNLSLIKLFNSKSFPFRLSCRNTLSP